MVSVDGDRFGVTDEAIADFCVQPDVHLDQEGEAAKRYGELDLENGSTTKNLFKRLVEASALSPRAHPVRIYLYPSPVEVEDLRDFAQHHSYMFPDEPEEEQEEMYDFPGKPHGADAAMDLQIVVRPCPDQLRQPGTSLIMIRAQRPHDFFFAPYDADQ
ncbi:hypothetical protein AAVH_17093 [Aphelenchoides avenae]|nr:hypothetical protein AAVH_17093 [Aphelenchus avenae]